MLALLFIYLVGKVSANLL